MSQQIKNIEDNCYGNNLRKQLVEIKVSQPNTDGINSFLNLCRKTLTLNPHQTTVDEYLDNFEELENFKNIEIRARWREYLSFRFRKEKKHHLRKAVFEYLKIYSSSEQYEYLIHSLRVVKSAKGLFRKELENIYEIGKLAIHKIDKPFLRKKIIVEIHSLFPTKTRADFEDEIKKQIKDLTTNHNYSDVKWLYEILLIIQAISKVEYKILIAENYERQGDYSSEDKEPNTYYPSILYTYQKGLKELKSISCDESLRKRLESKVLQEQMENMKMHLALAKTHLNTSRASESLINDFGDNCINQNEKFDFSSGFKSLISFPICINSKLEEKDSRNSSLSRFFDTYIKLDSKGKTVGQTTEDQFNAIESRKFWRECIINFLKKTKWYMDQDLMLERDTIHYYVLEKCDSIFIPEERKMLFARGISAGFHNDFITSAHILVPQLENSLKHILHSQGVLTAKIYNEIQHDKLLGGILDIYVERNGHEIFKELKDFLLENNSVNFRNELCHGLLSPFVIEHYGIYVWWLTLKLIYDKENVFKNNITTRS